ARRQDPGVVLESTLSSTDLWLKARSLKAVGELGRNDLLPVVKSNLNSEDPTSRFWAAWSGALLGEPSAIPVLQRLAEQGGERAESACAMALRRMPLQAAHEWQRELAGRPETLRMAVQALGVIGDPAGIPWLIERMAKPEVARVAGESFTMITGTDLAYEDLEGEKPEGFEAGPTENPEDENIEIDPDEDLPWPNPQLVERWWASHRLGFTNGTRYLLGKPMTVDWFNEVLRTGKQRQRTAAAIELSMREPGRPLFNTSAPGFRQQVLLQVR
ncbi:MAG: TIGR02270 family protein, partial [Nitrospira sp.]|nr:TIGR02270 family protein [Nitrospira sp.]